MQKINYKYELVVSAAISQRDAAEELALYLLQPSVNTLFGQLQEYQNMVYEAKYWGHLWN